MNTLKTAQKTLFREEAVEYQNEQKRTKSTSLKDGLLIVGITGGSLLFFVLMRIILGGIPDIVILMFPVLVIGLLFGLYRIIISLVRSEKQVACPECGTKHEIFMKERLYMCPECWTLLHMGKDDKVPIHNFLIVLIAEIKQQLQMTMVNSYVLIAGLRDHRLAKRLIVKLLPAPIVKSFCPRKRSIVFIAKKFSSRFPPTTRIGN